MTSSKNKTKTYEGLQNEEYYRRYSEKLPIVVDLNKKIKDIWDSSPKIRELIIWNSGSLDQNTQSIKEMLRLYNYLCVTPWNKVPDNIKSSIMDYGKICEENTIAIGAELIKYEINPDLDAQNKITGLEEKLKIAKKRRKLIRVE